MDRHKENNKTIRTKKFNDRNKLVYKTIIYPKIERHVTDLYIDVISEDRLDNLAYQYYKDVTLWWILAEANKVSRNSSSGIIKGSDKRIAKGSLYISPGQRIRIPNPERVPDILDSYYKMQIERL